MFGFKKRRKVREQEEMRVWFLNITRLWDSCGETDAYIRDFHDELGVLCMWKLPMGFFVFRMVDGHVVPGVAHLVKGNHRLNANTC